MANRELFFTFRYADWALAAGLEIMVTKITEDVNISWIDWTGKFQKRYEFPMSDRLYIFQIANRIRRSNLSRTLSNFGIGEQFNRTKKVPKFESAPQKIKILADEVAYLELISILRESSPQKEYHVKVLVEYRKTFLQTFSAAHSLLSAERPNKVFIYNGRFLQERAVWEACRELNIPVIFYEKFNPNWLTRYFLFEEPTHSPSYRSHIMSTFGEILARVNLSEFTNIGASWFKDRQLGKTQNYTKYQMPNLGFHVRKPFYVFFHSSEDELITTDLASVSWGSQLTALRTLIEVMNGIQEFQLVIRMHPNLLHKSAREIGIWEELGKEISKDYPWIHYISPSSPVSSYELIGQSVGVISVGSTIGVEAAFFEKKSILLGRAFHEEMKITKNPNSKHDLAQLIKQKSDVADTEKSKHNSLKYATFHAMGGTPFKWVSLASKKRRPYYYIEDFQIIRSLSVSILMRVEIWIKKLRNHV